MTTRNPDECIAIVEETLSYILLYAPDFPEEDETSTEEQFGQVLDDVKALGGGIQDLERRRWLELVARELVEARSCFVSGDSDGGMKRVQAAQGHLASWRNGGCRADHGPPAGGSGSGGAG